MSQLQNNRKKFEHGFALITSLLLLLLVTGLAIAVMYLATTQKQISGSDAETSVAFYGAEAGMEKMMADVANLYEQKQSPSISDLSGLTSLAPVIPGIQFSDPNVSNPYNVTAPSDGKGYPVSYASTISSSNQQLGGLQATIVPLTLAATARAPMGTEVRMFRKVEVALIPVFQFGVFCDADCSYFPGPDFQFGGRVHTNGNLWLAAGGTLTFYDKVTAAGNVIRKQLANTYNTTTGSYNGTVNIATAPAGCGSYPALTGSNCAALGFSQGSVTNGNYCSVANSAPNCDSTSSPNTSWPTNGGTRGISGPGGTYGSMLLSGSTGVTKLTLPFVAPGIQPIEIIRRAQSSDSSTLANSRLQNQASIRILLDDNPYNLSAGGPADKQNVPLAAVASGGAVNTSGWSPTPASPLYVATATNVNDLIQVGTSGGSPVWGADANWVVPVVKKGTIVPPNAPTLNGAVVDPYTSAYQSGATPDAADGSSTIKYPETWLDTSGAQKATDWPLLSGWIRVEITTSAGAKQAVTQEWLGLGFTRQFSAFPNSEFAVTNQVNANAIILLQQKMNPSRAQIKTVAGVPVYGDVFNTAKYPASKTNAYDLLPINFYDAREGELRDTGTADDASKTVGSCAVNGLMNAVEIDVGNLNKWLKGTIGSTGTSVDSSTYNGYILYFSDRRGGSLDGGYDYLDTINATNSINVSSSPVASGNVTSGMPDSVLSAEEDVYQGTVLVGGTPNGYPASLGGSPQTKLVTPPQFIGSAFGLGQITSTNPGVAQRIACSTTGIWNVVLAPRHVLRLVNGTLGNVPKKPDGTGGFTVASEQPVYVVGNYNVNAGTTWPAPSGNADSAAAIIADTVTLLSTSYSDAASMVDPLTPNAAGQSFYRMAIASGKTLTFKAPPSQTTAHQDFGTDGGVHNFLRYLENWGSTNLYYEGSMVSLFYSAYGTGSFKCCTTVYSPPHRIYTFDTNFLTPSLLPPGTPQFKDVVDLGFQQDLNP